MLHQNNVAKKTKHMLHTKHGVLTQNLKEGEYQAIVKVSAGIH